MGRVYTPEERRRAIASIESRGEKDPYKALGKRTKKGDRAYGKYQIMGANIPSWSKQALGRSITPEDFLNDPSVQDAIFDKIYGGFVQKHGERGASSKWFTGSPNEPNRSDVLGKLTGSSYADKYEAALNNTPGGQYTLKDYDPRADTPSSGNATPEGAPTQTADADRGSPSGTSGWDNFNTMLASMGGADAPSVIPQKLNPPPPTPRPGASTMIAGRPPLPTDSGNPLLAGLEPPTPTSRPPGNPMLAGIEPPLPEGRPGNPMLAGLEPPLPEGRPEGNPMLAGLEPPLPTERPGNPLLAGIDPPIPSGDPRRKLAMLMSRLNRGAA